MKSTLLCIWLFFCFNLYAIANISIMVKIKKAKPNTSIAVISNYYELDQSPICTSKIDENGIGNLRLKIENQRMLTVDIGGMTIHLLVKPDNNYQITYDAWEPAKISFTKDDSQINALIFDCDNFINDYQYKRKTYMDWETNDEFPEGMSRLENELSSKVNTYVKDNRISEADASMLSEYFHFETLFLKLNRYQASFNPFFGDLTAPVPLYYQNAERQVVLKDEYFEKGYYSYQFLLSDFAQIKVSQALAIQYEDLNSLQRESPDNFMSLIIEKRFETLYALKAPSQTKSYLVAVELMRMNNKADLEKYFYQYKNQFPASPFTVLIEKKISKLKYLTSGVNFPPITATDTRGNSITISDFKNKYIFIDLWSTSCGSCIKEIPDSYKLQKHFANRKDIIFLNISIDSDTAKWKTFINKNQEFIGEHVHLNEQQTDVLMEHLGISGVPRYMLVSKEGKIIDPAAPRPSEKNIIHFIADKISDL